MAKQSNNVYTLYHDRNYIIHCGYKPVGIIETSATWFRIGKVANELKMPVDSVHAFRIGPDKWEFFTRAAAVRSDNAGDIPEGPATVLSAVRSGA